MQLLTVLYHVVELVVQVELKAQTLIPNKTITWNRCLMLKPTE